VKDVARKVMGDAPIAYIEGAGGVRVAEDDLVEPGKNDVSATLPQPLTVDSQAADIIIQSWARMIQRCCGRHLVDRKLYKYRIMGSSNYGPSITPPFILYRISS
jgi:hypothetical protein